VDSKDLTTHDRAVLASFMADDPPDMAMSLGPKCAMAWHIRANFGVSTAYPFDWWIAPARSVLAMLDPRFEFDLEMTDIQITEKSSKTNTAFNRKLNVNHHHDFPRGADRHIEDISDGRMAEVKAKYHHLFRRMKEHIQAARSPMFFMAGVQSGTSTRITGAMPEGPLAPLAAPITEQEVVSQLTEFVGEKARLAIIAPGSDFAVHRIEDRAIRLQFPADLPPSQGHARWVQPVAGYAWAFETLGLTAGRQV
jgi:hypothetical protein